MQWVIWDEEINGPSSIMRSLPDALEGESITKLNELGYRELLSVQPEDYIQRFPGLLGSTVFEKREDGRVYQTYPDADYSVAAVRAELKSMAARDATNQLQGSDWYVVRSIETGKPIPEDIKEFRQKVRDHLDWIREDIDTKGARELVEYRWNYPNNNDQVMINGVPVYLDRSLDTTPTDSAGLEEDSISVHDSKTLPRRANVDGVRLDTVLDANDIPAPIVADPHPHLTDPAPHVADPTPHLRDSAPKIPPGDIRTMNQAQREKLPKGELERLIAQDKERQKKEGPDRD